PVTVGIGTRGSALALAQTRLVASRLGDDVEVRVLHTAGDRSERPIRTLADGAFVATIEEALLRREIDIAVHSLKDLPTAEREGLAVAAVPEREDPRDVLVTATRGGLTSLPVGAVVGTSSPSRAAFLRALRSDAITREIRGTVDTPRRGPSGASAARRPRRVLRASARDARPRRRRRRPTRRGVRCG